MITVDVFPAKQGFSPPPDGGVIVPDTTLPAPLEFTQVAKQGFPPAPNPLFNFTGPEAPAPLVPYQPASVPVPDVSVLSSPVPQAINVDVNYAAGKVASLNPRDVVISDAGSFEVNPGQAMQTYIVFAITDQATGGVATTDSVNLRLVLTGKPLTSYGVTLSGRSLLFTAGLSVSPGIVPERPILAWGVTDTGANVMIVSNKDSSGGDSLIFLGLSPGNEAKFDSARLDSEVVFQNVGILQNVVPDGTPLLPLPPLPSTLFPILDINAGAQINSFPDPKQVFVPQNPAALVDQIPGEIPNVDVIVQPPFIGLPGNIPSLEKQPASTSETEILIK